MYSESGTWIVMWHQNVKTYVKQPELCEIYDMKYDLDVTTYKTGTAEMD